MNFNQQITQDIADNLVNLGFTVYLSASKTYGFYTDDTGVRVVSFGTDLGSIRFSGNYNASPCSGTGWLMENVRLPLTKEYALTMLYANAPGWTHNSNPQYTTAVEHITRWGASKYEKYTQQTVLEGDTTP